jgi:hypothetical protein
LKDKERIMIIILKIPKFKCNKVSVLIILVLVLQPPVLVLVLRSSSVIVSSKGKKQQQQQQIPSSNAIQFQLALQHPVLVLVVCFSQAGRSWHLEARETSWFLC